MYENADYATCQQVFTSLNLASIAPAAQYWDGVHQSLAQVADQLAIHRNSLLAEGGWSGVGSQAFGAYMDALVTHTNGLATAAQQMNANLDNLVTGTQDITFPNQPIPPPPNDNGATHTFQLVSVDRAGQPTTTTKWNTTYADYNAQVLKQAQISASNIAYTMQDSATGMSQAQAAAPVAGPSGTFGITPVSGGGGDLGSSGSRRAPSAASPRSSVSGGRRESAAQSPPPSALSGGGPGAFGRAPSALEITGGASTAPGGMPLASGGSSSVTPGGAGASAGAAGGSGSRLAMPGVPLAWGTSGVSGPGAEDNFGAGGTSVGSVRSRGADGGAATDGGSANPIEQEPGIFGGRRVPAASGGGSRSTGSAIPDDGISGGAITPPRGASSPSAGRFGMSSGTRGALGGDPAVDPLSPGSASGSRLNASPAEEEAAWVRRAMGPGMLAEGDNPVQSGEGMPMMPGMGSGGDRGEQQRAKRTRYSKEDPATWASNKPVVPPVIE